MIESVTLLFPDGDRVVWKFQFSSAGTWQTPARGLPLSYLVKARWVRLDFYKCPECSLESSPTETCPVAVCLAQYGLDLVSRRSYDLVTVKVRESNRRTTLVEDVTLQVVVGQLVQLAVFQSRCPLGRRFRPVTKNLPVMPTIDEFLHGLSVLFALQKTRGAEDSDFGSVDDLRTLHQVFEHLCARLRAMGGGEANLNGVILLASLNQLFLASAPERIRQAIEDAQLAR